MPINPSTFLILSDIHFGTLSVSRDFAPKSNPPSHEMRGAVPMKDALIATVKKQGFKLSGILVPGDLTSIASPAEFEGSVNVVKEIASALSVENENVFFTFGNHDVDWRIAALSDLVDKDSLYNTVAASTGDLYVFKHPTEDGPVPGSGVFVRDSCTIFAINSGYHCYKSQDYPHGKLGKLQLDWLKDMFAKYSSDGFQVVAVHHHPFKYPFATCVEDISCIEEGAELVDLMGRYGIHVVCHGHRHEPKVFTEMRNNWKNPITFVCAGSVAVNEHHRNRGEIPNLFHLLVLDSQLSSGAAYGKLLSFQYRSATGWVEAQHSPSTPVDPIQIFGILANQNEQRQAATRIVKDMKSAAGADKVTLLPTLDLLPPELQCMFRNEMNDLFNELAVQEGGQLIGRYPGVVAIKF